MVQKLLKSFSVFFNRIIAKLMALLVVLLYMLPQICYYNSKSIFIMNLNFLFIFLFYFQFIFTSSTKIELNLVYLYITIAKHKK